MCWLCRLFLAPPPPEADKMSSNGNTAHGNGVMQAVSNGIASLTNGNAGKAVVPPASADSSRWAGVERPYTQVRLLLYSLMACCA